MIDPTYHRIDPTYHRISSRRDKDWFKVPIDPELLRPDMYSNKDFYQSYDEFGEWFEENCIGFWAYPNPHFILFTVNEDRIKFILKYS